MSKKLNIKLDSCFISTRVINDRAVKDAVYRNIQIVESFADAENIHQRVLKTLGIKSKTDSIYYEYAFFFKLLKEASAVVVGDKDSNDEFNNI